MKIGICDCSLEKVVYVYEADAPDKKRFGGPWGNSDYCKHVPFHEDTPEDASVLDLEMKDVDIQVGVKRIPDGVPKAAKDDNGDPIEDQNGDPVMVQDYKEVPVMETQKRIVLKAE